MKTRERPILFSGAMVRAILHGQKTQTRRVLLWKGAPIHHKREGGAWRCHHDGLWFWHRDDDGEPMGGGVRCPYGVPGDRLWVREAWGTCTDSRWEITAENREDNDICLAYRESGARGPQGHKTWCCGGVTRWRPSIHMPRWASRLTLEVVDVRIERVQDISGADAMAEGIDFRPCPCARATVKGLCSFCRAGAVWMFRDLWDSINAARGFGWDANPWVWVVSFRRLDDVALRGAA